MLNILFLQNCVKKGVLSGGETRFFSILDNLKNKIEFKVFGLFYSDELNSKFNINKQRVKRYALYDKFGIFISYILRIFEALLNINFEEYDIIYSTSDFLPDVIPAFFYKSIHPKTRWIQCIFHNYPDWKKRPGNKLINLLGYYSQRISFLFIKKNADKIILINNITKRELIPLKFNKKKLFVLDCGIDLNFISRVKPSKKKYDASFLARLNYSKGVFDLIPMWKRVCLDYPKATLSIVGKGDNKIKKELKRQILLNNLENKILLLGYLTSYESLSIIKSSKCFLFPSHEEGWGIAIAEAMACKIPVISWDLPVYKDVFKNYTCQIEENNINLFANKVIQLLKYENKRIKIANKGYNFIKKYSWDKVAKKEFKIIK